MTPSVRDVSGVMGREAEVTAEFCSDPGPIRVTWNWEQIVLPAGNEYGGELRGKLEPLNNANLGCISIELSLALNYVKLRSD